MGPGEREIELHDSQLNAMRMDGEELVLVVIAMVHAGEEGRITTWTQTAEFRLAGGEAVAGIREDGWIMDGDVIVDGDVIANCLPLPFDRVGEVRLSLSGYYESNSDNFDYTLAGDRLRIVMLGEPEFLEVFRGKPW